MLKEQKTHLPICFSQYSPTLQSRLPGIYHFQNMFHFRTIFIAPLFQHLNNRHKALTCFSYFPHVEEARGTPFSLSSHIIPILSAADL